MYLQSWVAFLFFQNEKTLKICLCVLVICKKELNSFFEFFSQSWWWCWHFETVKWDMAQNCNCRHSKLKNVISVNNCCFQAKKGTFGRFILILWVQKLSICHFLNIVKIVFLNMKKVKKCKTKINFLKFFSSLNFVNWF